MSYTRSILESGIVRTVISGTMDLGKSLASLNELSSLVKDNALFELVVHEPGSSISVGYSEASSLVKKALELFNGLVAGAIAFVADDDLTFALCRQLQMQLDNAKVQMQVFRNESAALEWLEEFVQNNP